MRFNLQKTLIALALAALAPLALADTPDTVGRIAALHGQVSIVPAGEASATASLNWPVAAGDRLSTARGAGAEFRVGAAAVRLDGDTELEISQLDDDSFKLRLNRGTASVRIADPAMLDGFELAADDARVVLLQPGWVRVDAGRQSGAVTVGVLAGSAQVDGPGASLQVLAGRQAELRNGDLLTGSLERDSFDNWPEPRQAAPAALRYVSPDVTGYEELDRYGNWSDSPDYGPLWVPSGVPLGWAPYQDGRWIWRDAWGWTWIDAAPWGYAPSHYGSWVQIGTRWGWAPGRNRPRPVWAPALVGWHGHYPDRPRPGVGGPRGPKPAVGWFPLTPRDRYVPGFRATPDYSRRVEAYREGRVDASRPPRPANAGQVRAFEPNRGQPGRPLQGNAPGTNFGQVQNQRDAQRANEPRMNAPGTNFGQAANQRDAQRENEQRQNAQRENMQRENAQREQLQRDNAQREREREGQQRPLQAEPGRQLRGRENEHRTLQTEAPTAPAVMPQPVMSHQPARQEAERPAARPQQAQQQAPAQPQPQPQLQQRPQPQPPAQPQPQAQQRPQPQPQSQPQAQQQAQPRPQPQPAQPAPQQAQQQRSEPRQDHKEQRGEARARGENARTQER